MNTVYFKNLQRQHRIDTKASRRLLLSAMRRLGVSGSLLTVVFCRSERIRELNRLYRDLDEPTDVLSFPAADSGEDGRTYLGDIFIAPEVAAEYARQGGIELADELAVLHLHGLLHLLGYDHETDAGQMLALQAALERELRPRGPAPSTAG
jgi:probable rRNA maturation factor